MSAITSHITSPTFVYSTVYSDTDERKHQSSASLAFVPRNHRWQVNSPDKGPVTRKMFPFDDDIKILPDRLFLLPGYTMSHKYAPVFVIVFKTVIQCILIFWDFLWYMLLRVTSLTVGQSMMTSSNGNIFRVSGHLCGEFTSPRWIPHTKASDAELWCLLWTAPN